jgi:hypothetical protein
LCTWNEQPSSNFICEKGKAAPVESDVIFNDWSTQDCITYVKLFFEKVMALCLFNLVMKRFIVNRHTAEKWIMTVNVSQVSFRLAA